MIQSTGWDLVRLLSPYVSGSTDNMAISLQIRSITIKLLDTIANCSNPREVYLMTLQTVNDIRWDSDFEDPSTAMSNTILFTVLNKMLPISKYKIEYMVHSQKYLYSSIVITRIKTKQLVRFLVSPIKAQVPALQYIEQLLHNGYGVASSEHSKKDEADSGTMWDEVVKVLITGIMDFTDFCAEVVYKEDIVSFCL